MGALRKLAVVVLAALAALAALPSSPAQAHAFLQGSNPADGSVLASAPAQLRLRFSESIVVSVTRLEIVGSDGTVWLPSRPRLEGHSEDLEDPVELVADLPALPRGAFRLSWQTLSSDDLHRTSGVLVFGIGQQVVAAGLAEPLPRAEEAVLRWGLFLALAGCLGGQLVGRVFRRRGYPHYPTAHCERIAAGAAITALACTAGLLIDQEFTSGIGLGQLLGYQYGHRWLVREAGLLLLLTGSLIARRRPSSLLRSAFTLSGTVAAGIGSALLGHAGAGSGITRVLADATHLTAAATWSGAVMVFAGVGWLTRRASAVPTVAMRSALRAFAAPAAGCVALMTVTGVYLTSTVVGSVDAALLTFYGRVLLVKLALFLALTLLALTNHRRVRRPGAPVRLALRTEAGFAVVALAAAALLASSQPAREPQFVRPPTATTVPVLSGSVADLQQSLAMRPNLPGGNIILIEVSDTRRPAPAPIGAVLVTVTDSGGGTVGPLTAHRSAEGSWSASADLAVSGRAVVRVSVRRPGLAPADRDYLWTVGSRSGALQPATVSNAPIAGLLRDVSAGLAAVLAVLLLAGTLRARRSGQRAVPASANPPGGAGTPAVVKTGAE